MTLAPVRAFCRRLVRAIYTQILPGRSGARCGVITQHEDPS